MFDYRIDYFFVKPNGVHFVFNNINVINVNNG